MSDGSLESRAMHASLEHKLFGVPLPQLTIGRFIVLERLGQGGMGVVFAVYDDRLDRRVALKVIKADASTELRQRLQREAQAMAKLSHPNVVPVFEVGDHEEQLFIVMEYVRGQTLRAWGGQQRRTVEDILEKYIQAGRGLEAAHAEGIVHRDFKPDNVIVGASGRVRVLDFGLARAHTEIASDAEITHPASQAEREGPFDTPLTQTGSMVGTPAYMAPEQWSGLTPDHRSDQFSFCVSLWEALGDSRPFPGHSKAQLVAAMLDGKPSAPDRAIPARVRRVLERGLAPSPDDRFGSMTALLTALERSGGRRHARWVQAGMAAGLTAGLVAAGAWAARDAGTDACVDGPAVLAEVWDDARRARVVDAMHGVGVPFAATTATKVDGLLRSYTDGWTTAYREACEATRVERTQSETVMQQRMRCLDDRRRHLDALASVLEDVDAASLEKAVQAAAGLPAIDRCGDLDYVATEEPPLGDADAEAERIRILDDLVKSETLYRAGRYADANATAERAMKDAEALDHPPVVVRAATQLANAQFGLGKYDVSATTALRGFVLADDASRRVAALNLLALGHALGRQGRHAEAIAHDRRALALLDRTGADATTRAAVHLRLGEELRENTELEAAHEIFETALQLSTTAEDRDDVVVAKAYQELGAVLEAQGKYEEALEPTRAAVETLQHTLGPEHPDVAGALVSLGIKLGQLRRPGEAQELYQQALDIQLAAYGDEHPQVATTYYNFALSLVGEGKYDEALKRYERALQTWKRALGEGHPLVATAHNAIGTTYQSKGEYAQALSHHEAALGILKKAHGEDHASLADTHANLGNALSANGRHTEALAHLRRSLQLEVAALGENHPYVASDHNALVETLSALGRYDEAREHANASLTIWNALGPERPRSGWAHLGMGYVEAETESCDAALEHLRTATKRFDAAYPKAHPDHARPAAAVAICAHRQGHADEADAAIQRLQRLAEQPDQPPFVPALLALARAVRSDDRTAVQAARARLAGLNLRPFEVLTARR